MKYCLAIIFFIISIGGNQFVCAHQCPSFNHRGFCTVMGKYTPRVEVFRPKGIRFTVPEHEGLQKLTVRANINRPIEPGDKADLSFDLVKKDGRWVHFIANRHLNIGDKVNFFLRKRQNNHDVIYEKRQIVIKALTQSATKQVPNQRKPVAAQKPVGNHNNACPCCPAGAHSSATASATATVNVIQQVVRPVQPPQPIARPTPRHPENANANQHQSPKTTAKPAPATPAVPATPVSHPISTPSQPSAAVQASECPDSNQNGCDINALINTVIKLENAEYTIDSLMEVMHYLLMDSKIKGTKLVYSMGAKAPGTGGNPKQIIQSFLADDMDMLDLENQILSAEFSNERGITFEMKRPIDKLRIIYRAVSRLKNSIDKIIDPEAAEQINASQLVSYTTTEQTSTTGYNFNQVTNMGFTEAPYTDESNSYVDESFWRIDETHIRTVQKAY